MTPINATQGDNQSSAYILAALMQELGAIDGNINTAVYTVLERKLSSANSSLSASEKKSREALATLANRDHDLDLSTESMERLNSSMLEIKDVFGDRCQQFITTFTRENDEHIETLNFITTFTRENDEHIEALNFITTFTCENDEHIEALNFITTFTRENDEHIEALNSQFAASNEKPRNVVESMRAYASPAALSLLLENVAIPAAQ